MWELKILDFHPIEALLAVAFCILAFWRFSLALWGYVADPIKQARQYGMTAAIVQRSNLIILWYSLYLFYEFIMSLYQQPGMVEHKLLFDLGIKLAFVLTIISLFGQNLGDLSENAGPGVPERRISHPRKMWHLVKVLRKRGLSLIEFGLLMPTLAAMKWYAQGSLPWLMNRLGLVL